MIVIIDYECGNPASIRNMLKKIGYASCISSDEKVIQDADKLILPGVGSFDHGMMNLEEMGLIPVLNKRVIEERIPILGICLGVQLFCSSSVEGGKSGLGWINADVINFDKNRLSTVDKVPHMEWTDTIPVHKNRLISEEDEIQRYYYVHSFHLACHDETDILATATHGYQFVSAIEKDNIVGVQFHPEKSHKFGMKLLNNFVMNY